MTERYGIGVVGCGAISGTYLDHAARFGVDIVAVADLVPERARQAAERAGAQALTTPQLLAAADVRLVLNLTQPRDHVGVGLAAIEAGKDLYSEKPLAVNREDGRRLLDAGARAGLSIGGAPDTFLGTGIQTCRRVVDEGAIGRPVAATAFLASHGHESWHPDPEFYYQPGGGPLFDMGPYYLTALITLLGPVARVAAFAGQPSATRTIGSGPRAGTTFAVEVATHVAGTLEFESGAIATLVMSFEMWAAQLPRFEIYGTEGVLSGPDPNHFGGPVRLWRPEHRAWEEVEVPARDPSPSRGVGLADMIEAIATGRTPRASGQLAYHVLDVMCSLLDSARERRQVEVESTVERPAPAL